MGWMIGVLGFNSQWGLGILLTTMSRTALGPHPLSYTVGTGGSFPGGKVVRATKVKECVELHSPRMPS